MCLWFFVDFSWLFIFGFVTTSIAFNANAATVKAALEAIPAIIGVNVGYNTGSALCAANGGAGIVSTFTWTHLPGDVPTLTFPTNGLGSAMPDAIEARRGVSKK